MKDNKVKKGLSLAAAITALCLGSISCILTIVGFIEIISILSNYAEYYLSASIGVIILGVIIDLGLEITIIVTSAKAIKPFKEMEDGTLSQRLGLKITLAIMLGLLMLIYFIGSVSGVVFGILYLICLGLLIAGMSIPMAQFDAQVEAATTIASAQPVAAKPVVKAAAFAAKSQPADSFEGKVRELKHLKDLAVLSDEQFTAAFEKLTEDFKQEILKGMSKDEI